MSLDSHVFENLPRVEATLKYLTSIAEKPVNYTYEPPPGVSRQSGVYEAYMLPIRDARSIRQDLSLNREGFTLTVHCSAVRNFYDEDEVRRVYYTETEQLVADVTGAARVLAFDHTVRRRTMGRPPLSSGGRSGGSALGEPVALVHNDYTLKSGPQRVHDLLGTEAEVLLRGRFAFVNVWRPIRAPLLDAPLAVCDARSVVPEDLVAAEIVYPDRTGEIYVMTFNPDHRWFYISGMKEDEALLIKCYDSSEDGRARFTPHTAFEDPTTPTDALPRESIELRTLVFYPA